MCKQLTGVTVEQNGPSVLIGPQRAPGIILTNDWTADVSLPTPVTQCHIPVPQPLASALLNISFWTAFYSEMPLILEQGRMLGSRKETYREGLQVRMWGESELDVSWAPPPTPPKEV